MVLNLIDGLMFQILSSKSLDEKGCGGGEVFVGNENTFTLIISSFIISSNLSK